MSGDVEDVRIGLEHVLRAVAVVDIVVDDGDLRGTLGAGVRRRDGDIVVEAEPHRSIALGVVAGRAYQGDGPAVRPAHHALDRVNRGAGGQQRYFVGLR